MGASSLCHTRWDCGYHNHIHPEISPETFLKEVRREVWDILRTLCGYKNVEVVKGSSVDHVHMYVKIPPRSACRSSWDTSKESSALMVFDRFPEMKQGRGRHLRARGYYVSTVGINKDVIREYIERQEEADIIEDKASQ